MTNGGGTLLTSAESTLPDLLCSALLCSVMNHEPNTTNNTDVSPVKSSCSYIRRASSTAPAPADRDHPICNTRETCRVPPLCARPMIMSPPRTCRPQPTTRRESQNQSQQAQQPCFAAPLSTSLLRKSSSSLLFSIRPCLHRLPLSSRTSPIHRQGNTRRLLEKV